MEIAKRLARYLARDSAESFIACDHPELASPLTPGVKYGEYKYVRQAIQ